MSYSLEQLHQKNLELEKKISNLEQQIIVLEKGHSNTKSYTMASDANCLFCKIVKGQIPSHKVYEDDHVLAFLDINPLSEGHTLVIPKHHAVKIHELPEAAMSAVGPVLVKVAKALHVDNYNLLQNNGALAHQAVMHVHFHIIPKPNDKEGLGIKWPQGSTDHEKFKKKAEELKARI